MSFCFSAFFPYFFIKSISEILLSEFVCAGIIFGFEIVFLVNMFEQEETRIK